MVVGASGQDGTYLTQALVARGYLVLGIDLRNTCCSDGTPTPQVDIARPDQVAGVVRSFAPDEIYYLAAYHHSAEDAELNDPASIWTRSHATHVEGLLHFLEAQRLSAPASRLFYAASSLIFGECSVSPQTEETPFNPRCIYGITKTTGVHLCRLYRRQYAVFASVGIMYNHESHLRPARFLSRKIVRAALRAKAHQELELVVGDLAAEVDWGYAPDYVDAASRILQLPAPDDFIVATGETHRVQDWVEIAFGKLGLDWRKHVREDTSTITRRGRGLVGDSGKLRRMTGWRPTLSFAGMVSEMLRLEEATS